MIILDVKPWDDETDMAKLEAYVRSVEVDGLLWGSCASRLFYVPVVNLRPIRLRFALSAAARS